MDDSSEKKSLGSMLKRGISGAVEDIKQMGANLSKKALDEAIATEAVQNAGSKYIREAINDTVKDVKDRAGSLVTETKKKIVGEQDIKIYDQIRDGLRTPNEPIMTNIFRNIIARVMSGVAGIGGWIGATFANVAFKPTDAEKVKPNDITQIFGSFMAGVFGRRTQAQAGT